MCWKNVTKPLDEQAKAEALFLTQLHRNYTDQKNKEKGVTAIAL